MPCTSVFDAQDADWRNAVLPPGVPCVAIEAGVPEGWWRYVGSRGAVIGMTRFGASGQGKDLFRHFGFTAEAVVATAEALMTNGVT